MSIVKICYRPVVQSLLAGLFLLLLFGCASGPDAGTPARLPADRSWRVLAPDDRSGALDAAQKAALKSGLEQALNAGTSGPPSSVLRLEIIVWDWFEGSRALELLVGFGVGLPGYRLEARIRDEGGRLLDRTLIENDGYGSTTLARADDPGPLMLRDATTRTRAWLLAR